MARESLAAQLAASQADERKRLYQLTNAAADDIAALSDFLTEAGSFARNARDSEPLMEAATAYAISHEWFVQCELRIPEKRKPEMRRQRERDRRAREEAEHQ